MFQHAYLIIRFLNVLINFRAQSYYVGCGTTWEQVDFHPKFHHLDPTPFHTFTLNHFLPFI